MNPDQLTFSWAAHPASRSASLDSERDWLTRVATWRLSIWRWLTDCGPAGWSGRTSPASCRPPEGQTLDPSSPAWANSGMGGRTECWTLNTLEYPSAGVACSLSDILETGDVPQRYYLSATACRGILRRAARRGKDLPPALQHALKAVADSEPMPSATEP